MPAIKVAMLASFWPVPPVISLIGAMAIGYPGRVESWLSLCGYSLDYSIFIVPIRKKKEERKKRRRGDRGEHLPKVMTTMRLELGSSCCCGRGTVAMYLRTRVTRLVGWALHDNCGCTVRHQPYRAPLRMNLSTESLTQRAYNRYLQYGIQYYTEHNGVGRESRHLPSGLRQFVGRRAQVPRYSS